MRKGGGECGGGGGGGSAGEEVGRPVVELEGGGDDSFSRWRGQRRQMSDPDYVAEHLHTEVDDRMPHLASPSRHAARCTDGVRTGPTMPSCRPAPHRRFHVSNPGDGWRRGKGSVGGKGVRGEGPGGWGC